MKLIFKIVLIFILISAFIASHEIAHAQLYAYDGLRTHYGVSWHGFYTQVDVGQPEPTIVVVLGQYWLDSLFYTVFPFYCLLIGYIFIKKSEKK